MRAFSQSLGGDDGFDSAIRNYELAFRMQSMIPEILDLSEETRATQADYAVDSKVKSQSLFGIQCLRARRLVESGVRFVEITCAPGNANGTWDQHSNLKKGHEKNSLDTDQSSTALIKDRKARGMLDETLVLVISEHGRTPKIDSKPAGAGRHHWSRVYSQLYAGGGMGRGQVVGRWDRQGGDVAANPISAKDILATAFHLLGIDPETTIPNAVGQPMPMTGTGRLRPELLFG